MKDQARGFVIGTIVLAIALPVLYVGTEGAWYLATGESSFDRDSTYRKVYAPLDWAGERCPAVDDGREALATGWLRLRGDWSRVAYVRPLVLPSPYYAKSGSDLLLVPTDEFEEFKLSREAAAMKQFELERATGSAACVAGDSCFFEASYARQD